MDRKKFIQISGLGIGLALIPGIARTQHVFGKDKMEADEDLSPKMASPELGNSYWYIGQLLSLLISSKDTGGSFSLIHNYEIQGLEPPPHTHTKEDESFYLINGEIDYFVGDKMFHAKAGNWVFLPRNIQHSFKVITTQAEVLIHLSPGGFEDYFIEMSEPAKEMVIPPRPQGPPDVQRIIETASKYGIIFPA